MTYQSAIPPLPSPSGALCELRHVLALVEEIAGRPPSACQEEGLDIGAAYESAFPIVQRRFDALAARIAAKAAAGVEALIALEERQRPTGPAAERLAAELNRAVLELRAVLAG